jgi:ketosteroid isomerase-like protein
MGAGSTSFATLQSDMLITRTLRPLSDVRICNGDMCGGGEMLRLSKLLLSRQGMIEVQGQLGLFIVTDERDNVESIARLFEAYHEPNSLVSQSRNASNAGSNDSEAAAIRAVLDAQAAAWNRGDVEAYMDGYDRSPKTEFVGGDSITRGWQEVLDRYKQKYDTREKMGTLTFSDLEINMLSGDAALALGRWRLKRATDEPHGTFTLLFRKTKAGWRIVHDHSSSA